MAGTLAIARAPAIAGTPAAAGALRTPAAAIEHCHLLGPKQEEGQQEHHEQKYQLGSLQQKRRCNSRDKCNSGDANNRRDSNNRAGRDGYKSTDVNWKVVIESCLASADTAGRMRWLSH